jgi:DNA polymerase V
MGEPMRQAIASYATCAAEKMRRFKVAAENSFVFMHSSTFNHDPFYSNGASARFAGTTNDAGEVVALAVRLEEPLWRDGFRYSKCGVMITELLPDTIRQPALWGELDRDRREQAWKVMDKLNSTLGRDTPPHPRGRAEGCRLEAQGRASLATMDNKLGRTAASASKMTTKEDLRA